MYNAEDLIKVLNRRPFVPLKLEISSGESLAISHPEQAMVTSTDGVIVTEPAEQPGRVNWRLIGLDHVVGVRISETAN